jgi:hypothetical protein
LQPSILRRKQGDTELIFPAEVTIEVGLAPAASLGSSMPGRTHTAGKLRLSWNASTDRYAVKSLSPLPPVQVVFDTEAARWVMHSERVKVTAKIADDDQLFEWLDKLSFGLAELLNLELEDATAVLGMSLRIGNALYKLEYAPNQLMSTVSTSSDIQAERVKSVFRRLDAPSVLDSRRLQAALHYFHVACRLLSLPESPWEFMPEAILNMNKVLEVLFSTHRLSDRSNSEAYAELERLGLEKEKREILISIMKLRNHLDVAHVDTWEISTDSLSGVYSFLYRTEVVMREMLQLLVQRMESGDFVLKADWDSQPKKDVIDLLEYLRLRYSRQK